MRAVGDILDANILIDQNRRFTEYKEKFDPDKVEVITYNEINVGRLRVVRNLLEIYIGGIQIKAPYKKAVKVITKIIPEIVFLKYCISLGLINLKNIKHGFTFRVFAGF